MNRKAAPMKRDEDREQTLIYVDMLGFADLTKKHPCRIEDAPPNPSGFEGSGTAPTQTQYTRFDRVLDNCAWDQRLRGGITPCCSQTAPS